MNLEERNFLKEKLDYIYSRAFPFQLDCDKELIGKNNVILSMPTGSGKTDRFLAWAINILLNSNIKKVIITAPIKALSDQRFRELYLEGYNVGLETGDVRYNVDDCTFLCCTQEIATNKYIDDDVITVIDEFHYIYNDSRRSRTYIDYIINTKADYLFLCSATLGNLTTITDYLKRISNRDFYRCENKDTLTNKQIKSSIELKDIKNAYVVSFKSESCVKNANIIRNERKERYEIDEEIKERILKTASKYDVDDPQLIFDTSYGVAYYYGSMLPKERLFVTELIQNKLIDTICGTDAISLGLNFPIEKIVFTDLRKSNENVINKIIDKNLFNQIIGRAGRYGMFSEGLVYYSTDLQSKKSLKDDFIELLSRKEEDVHISVMPSISNIISGIKTIDEEIEYAKNNSISSVNEETLLKYINEKLDIVRHFSIEESLEQFYFNRVIYPNKYKEINYDEILPEDIEKFKNKYGNLNIYQQEFCEGIMKLYDDEFDPIDNCLLLRDVICNFDLDTILKDSTRCFNGDYKNRFKVLLQVRKYLNNLPNKYKERIDLAKLDEIVSNIDPSVFDVKFSFQDYSKFNAYNLFDSRELIIRAKANQKSELKNSLKVRRYLDGTLIKDEYSVISENTYLILFHDNKEYTLLNYGLYSKGVISIITQSKLIGYSQITNLKKGDLKKILYDCRKEIGKDHIQRSLIYGKCINPYDGTVLIDNCGKENENKFLILYHDNEEYTLLNYDLYLKGTKNITTIKDLKGFSQVSRLKNDEFYNILSDCGIDSSKSNPSRKGIGNCTNPDDGTILMDNNTLERFIVLRHGKQYYTLLNYDSYLNGVKNITKIEEIKGFSQYGILKKEDFKRISSICSLTSTKNVLTKNIRYKVGTLIKDNDPTKKYQIYLVLEYINDKCILLNYDLYMQNIISVKSYSILSGFSNVRVLEKEEYEKALLKYKKNYKNSKQLFLRHKK